MAALRAAVRRMRRFKENELDCMEDKQSIEIIAANAALPGPIYGDADVAAAARSVEAAPNRASSSLLAGWLVPAVCSRAAACARSWPPCTAGR